MTETKSPWDERVFFFGRAVWKKFAQLLVYHGDEQIPFLSCVDGSHAQAVRFALERLEIPYEFEQGSGERVPNPVAEGKYEVVGAGFLHFYKERNLIVVPINSLSRNYDKGFNPEHFEKVRPFFPQGLEVRVE